MLTHVGKDRTFEIPALIAVKSHRRSEPPHPMRHERISNSLSLLVPERDRNTVPCEMIDRYQDVVMTGFRHWERPTTEKVDVL
jgi:hypothetical protein